MHMLKGIPNIRQSTLNSSTVKPFFLKKDFQHPIIWEKNSSFSSERYRLNVICISSLL